MPFKIAFFGTHNFAAKILQGLHNSPDFIVDLVVTQPDQLAGRNKKIQLPPVKILAQEWQLKVKQPETLKKWNANLSEFDVAVVAQYGKIIPPHVLNMPKHGMINVHASLLPKYRGASPIQFALLNGDSTTGVTIMKMDEKMDTGPILSQQSIDIKPDDIYPSLENKLAEAAIPLLLQTLKSYLGKQLEPRPQNEVGASYTKILRREDGLIDFNKKAEEIYNQWRAYLPWPGTFFIIKLHNQTLKIKLLQINMSEFTSDLPAGSLFKISKNRLGIVGGDGKILEILELQPENKKSMRASEFLNGYKIF